MCFGVGQFSTTVAKHLVGSLNLEVMWLSTREL